MRLAAALAAVAALALGAATAAGQGTTERSGETAEGVGVRLELGEFGNPTSFAVGRTKVECKRGGTLTTQKTTYTDFVTSDPGAFRLKQGNRSSDGPFTFKSRTKASGSSSDKTLQNWSGTLKEKTKVIRDGEKIDTCRLRTTWTAS
jgi:hypothetical protein